MRRRPALAACSASLTNALDVLADCFRRGHRVYLCGNGGSAADCEHWAAELMKGFRLRRPPQTKRDHALPVALRGLQEGLPMIPLTGYTSLRTAVSNDLGSDLEFAQPLWVLGQTGDVLVALSTSGRSLNVLRAAQVARARSMRVIALTGASGGLLRRLADPCVRVPEVETHLVQEAHLAVYHALSLALEEMFFGAAGAPSNVARPRR
jgi:D-sedoheptulose 7-phosphate isomerase